MNLGILNFSYLEIVYGTNFVLPYDIIAFKGAQYVDPLFPSRPPVYCLEDSLFEFGAFCVLRMGQIFAMPIFNHVGAFRTKDFMYPLITPFPCVW